MHSCHESSTTPRAGVRELSERSLVVSINAYLEWGTTFSVASTIGVSREALRRRLLRARVNFGLRPGLSIAQHHTLNWLQREVRDIGGPMRS